MKRCLIFVILSLSLTSAVFQGNIKKSIEHFENKDYQVARKSFMEYLRDYPDHPVAHYYLGRIDFEEGSFSNAIDNFDLAIAKDTNNYLYFFWRGRTNLALLMEANLMLKGIYSRRTLKDFEKAVELCPDDLESRIYLAEYYGQAPAIAGGSWTKSIFQFKAALEKHSEVPYLYAGLGNLYRNAAKYDSAFHYYNKGLEIFPDDPLINYEFGKAGADSGKELGLAEKYLIKSLVGGLNLFQQSDAYFQLGKVREQLDKKNLARLAYEECLKINIDHLECKKAIRKLN